MLNVSYLSAQHLQGQNIAVPNLGAEMKFGEVKLSSLAKSIWPRSHATLGGFLGLIAEPALFSATLSSLSGPTEDQRTPYAQPHSFQDRRVHFGKDRPWDVEYPWPK